MFVAQSVFERQRTAITKVQLGPNGRREEADPAPAEVGGPDPGVRRGLRSAPAITRRSRAGHRRDPGDVPRDDVAAPHRAARARARRRARSGAESHVRRLRRRGSSSSRRASGIQTARRRPRPALPAADRSSPRTRPQRPPRPMTRLLSAPAANESRASATRCRRRRTRPRPSAGRASAPPCRRAERRRPANPSRRNPPGQSRPTETEAAAAIRRRCAARLRASRSAEAGRWASNRPAQGPRPRRCRPRRRDHAAMHPASPRKANAVQKSPRDGGSANSPAHRGSPQEHGKQHRRIPRHSDTATAIQRMASKAAKRRLSSQSSGSSCHSAPNAR